MHLIKKILKSIPLFKNAYAKIKRNQSDRCSIEQQLQKNLMSYWLSFGKKRIIYKDIKDAGFRCYSQFEEDGIILYLLCMVGIKTKKVVEICCGNGFESMSANLILNHGFKAYLFEGDKNNIDIAKSFFASQKDCLLVRPNFNQSWITRANINKLLLDSGAEGEVDVLSLDMDGNDYYIWEAINVINPRICVFETNNIIPYDKSITIPYDENFFAINKTGAKKEFLSVSLAAMNKLSQKKGYTLVGSHKHGFNIFYVRNDLLSDILPKPTLKDIHNNEYTMHSQKEKWPLVKDFPWVEI